MHTYINLTSGLEYLKYLDTPSEIGFIRIQSTWCEQKRWGDIILDLDYDFLFKLALGCSICIIDFSRHPRLSRAMWQGIPWILFATRKNWFSETTKTKVRNSDCTKYFESCYDALEEKSRKKLNYFSRFAKPPGGIIYTPYMGPGTLCDNYSELQSLIQSYGTSGG